MIQFLDLKQNNPKTNEYIASIYELEAIFLGQY